MHVSKRQPKSNDPWDIARLYAEFDHPQRRRNEKLSEPDIEWAWKRYSDENQPTSLRAIGDALGVSSHLISDLLRLRYGYDYARMAERRGSCGDLFKRHIREVPS